MLIEPLLRRVIRQGELTVTEVNGRTHRFGVPQIGRQPVHVRFTDRRVAFDILRNPRLGFGEAYMDGRIEMLRGDILDMLDLFRSNAPTDTKTVDDGLRRGNRSLVRRLFRANPIRRSRRNVAHHYDLDDRLYDIFLDADRQYSCAYFTDPANSLEQAQRDKKAHIAAKLDLKPGQRVLDIGCGWGGMALYLHEVADVDVLGITLSEEQLKVARTRAAAAGVADRVRFELIDYRDLTGQFDRIVSVGMFEHVGVPHFDAFFAKCRSLLTLDGVMLLHTIGRMFEPGETDRFTEKYIFPGGYIPSLSETVTASERQRLIVSDVEVLRLHYALTIEHWYARCVAARDRIVTLYDERFYRMWTYYLAGSIVAFRWGGMVNHQVQFVRQRRALPITRDYIGEGERALGVGVTSSSFEASAASAPAA